MSCEAAVQEMNSDDGCSAPGVAPPDTGSLTHDSTSSLVLRGLKAKSCMSSRVLRITCCHLFGRSFFPTYTSKSILD